MSAFQTHSCRSQVNEGFGRDTFGHTFDRRGFVWCLGKIASYLDVPPNISIPLVYGILGRAPEDWEGHWLRHNFGKSSMDGHDGLVAAWFPRNLDTCSNPVQGREGAVCSSLDRDNPRIRHAKLGYWPHSYNLMFFAMPRGIAHRRSYVDEPCMAVVEEPFRKSHTAPLTAQCVGYASYPEVLSCSSIRLRKSWSNRRGRVGLRDMPFASLDAHTTRTLSRLPLSGPSLGTRWSNIFVSRDFVVAGMLVCTGRIGQVFAFDGNGLSRQSSRKGFWDSFSVQTASHRMHTLSCNQLYSKEWGTSIVSNTI